MPAVSITHQHLPAVNNTECARTAFDTVRVLDVGCGNGARLGYLALHLPLLNPARCFDLYGLDVYTPGVQKDGFFDDAHAQLSAACPGIDCRNRLQALEGGARWPYPDDFFQAIVSSQLLEQVDNHDLMFGEIARTLAYCGWSAPLLPLKHSLYEGHPHLPLVRGILKLALQRSSIRTLSRLGLGQFRAPRASVGCAPPTPSLAPGEDR